MKTSTLIALMVAVIAVGLGAAIVIMAIFPGAAKASDSGMIWTLCLISLAAAGYAFFLIEWHNLGKPASWRWLKRNTMLEVMERIDVGNTTYLVIEHRGEPRMFRFDVRLSEDIRAGSTFVIQKNFGRPELGLETGDGRHILNVIKPLRACL